MANTQVAYLNQSIAIPRITEVSKKPEYIGHGQRTILGTYRYDSIAIKESYKIKAEYLTPSEFEDIENHLISNNGAITEFWLDEFGGDSTTDSVDAHVILTDVERVQFGRNGVWYNNGKNLEFEVIIV